MVLQNKKENTNSPLFLQINTVWFHCRLCSMKDCVVPHLKMCHSMDLATYEAQFMQPDDWPSQGALLGHHQPAAVVQPSPSRHNSRRSSIQSVDSGPGDLAIVDSGGQDSPGRGSDSIWNRSQ